MDPLPLIPENEKNHDVSDVIRETFQEVLQEPKFPQELAENLQRYNINDDYNLCLMSRNVLEINQKYDETLFDLTTVEYDVMIQQGLNLIKLDQIEQDITLRERTKLKPTEFCNNFSHVDKLKYSLIEMEDILPDKITQAIDFRYNKQLHMCENCVNVERITPIPSELELEDEGDHVVPTIENQKDVATKISNTCIKPKTKVIVKEIKPPRNFLVDPKTILFRNYKIGQTYKQIVTITNISKHSTSFTLTKIPTSKCLSITLDTNSKQAPGMSCKILLVFHPDTIRNIDEYILIQNSKGERHSVFVRIMCDSPLLKICILRRFPDVFVSATFAENFEQKRCDALNWTVDCGTCLVDNFVMLCIIIKNESNSANFFMMAEEEWLLEKITNVTKTMEFFKESFWIFPTYFRITKRETAEIHIIFQPTYPGLHLETFLIICDNNSRLQMEIIGDALWFRKDFISFTIPPIITPLDTWFHVVNLGHVMSYSPLSFRIAVENKSPINFAYYWIQSTKEAAKVFEIHPDWIELDDDDDDYFECLPKYRTTKFIFIINLETDQKGYYHTFLNFFVSNIPVKSLEEDTEFIVKSNETCSNDVDVCLLQLEVACYVEIFKPFRETMAIKRMPGSLENLLHCCKCMTPAPPEPIYISKLKFSTNLLDFGLLPMGADVEKYFYVENLTDMSICWKIVEIKYDTDITPYMSLLPSAHVAKSTGKFIPPISFKHNSYKIINKDPIRWASILLLFSITQEPLILESVCMVTYEIIQPNVVINTGHPTFPLLCPLELFYVGISKTFSINVENRTLLLGCFKFMPPRGNDVDNVQVDLHPKSGILPALGITKVSVTITCKHVGIFEDVYVPCFYGLEDKISFLRVLCAVDFPHLVFYLPCENKSFEKIIWPPNIVYEHDHNWCICNCEDALEDYPKVFLNKESNLCLLSSSSGSQVADVQVKPPVEPSKSDLLKIVKENFGDELFLQRKVVQLPNVSTKTLTKCKFFIENVSPLELTCSLESTNFPANIESFKISLQTVLSTMKLYKTDDEIWRTLCDNEYGIVVHPEVASCKIKQSEVVPVTIFIYATTWGVYTEEIVVDIQDLPCFCFSLIVEVVGSPIEFPLALNSLRDSPIIRFGHVSFNTDTLIRKIKLVNISTVPVIILWTVFLHDGQEDELPFNVLVQLVPYEDYKPEVFLTHSYMGKETKNIVTVNPWELHIEAQSTSHLEISLEPKKILVQNEQIRIKCTLLGFVYLRDNFRCKPNYFCRKSGKELSPIRLYVTGNVEIPKLHMLLGEGEIKMEAFANELMFNPNFAFKKRLMFSNIAMSTVSATLKIEPPFVVSAPVDPHVVVEPNEELEVILSCPFKPDDIMAYSEILYNSQNNNTLCDLDQQNKVVKITKELLIVQENLVEQVQRIPIKLWLHFPSITVTPWMVKFKLVTVNSTKKDMISLYNLSGYLVKFVVFKSSEADCFVISPNEGEIPGSTGMNKSFKDIFIYFTPRDVKQYKVVLRIVTNFPSHFIDVPIKGEGAINEKFIVEHKM